MLYARFAPTPSGFLHYGNALNFIITWIYARYHGAKLGLRIDDFDSSRCHQKYISNIFDTLEWLGLEWDEAPKSILEFNQKYIYKYREKHYRNFLLHVKQQPWVYTCACSRKDLNNPQYVCTCKSKNLPLIPYKTALKLDLKSFNSNLLFGVNTLELIDPVLWRKEDIPAYHLASLYDDSSKGRCLLVRGDDLREASAIQLLLARGLKITEFEKSIFIHHPLIADSHGKKLSKTRDAKPIDLNSSNESIYFEASKIMGLEPALNPYSLLEAFGLKQKSFGFKSPVGGEK